MAERKLDQDRAVALEQLPRGLRPAVEALWKLDNAFADIISTSSDPRLGAIRLAWWRERLEELDRHIGPPAEPRLQAVAAEIVPGAATGEELSLLEDAWLPALQPFPWGAAQAEGFCLRGRILFRVAARIVGGDPNAAESAGELWSLIDAAVHCSDRISRELLLDHAHALELPPKIPRELRPLTIIVALAVQNVRTRSRGTARGIAAAIHRLTGRIAKLDRR